MHKNIKAYISLMRFDRPIGTLLLLWPTLIALWLAGEGKPNYKIVLIFVLGVIIMRAAGCIINDYADREIDRYVARTKDRPIAAGIISPHRARILFIILLACGFVLVMHLNNFTVLLAAVAVLLTLMYPYAKRIIAYPQIVLGMAFSWSIPMVYAAILNGLTVETWVLYLANLLWVVAYDTEYAMADKVDDLKIGVKSTAIAFGNFDKTMVLMLQVLSLGWFVLIGFMNNFDGLYYLLLLIPLGLVFYQQKLIKNRSAKKCIKAFLNNNYFGMFLFVAVLVAEYLKSS